MACAAGSVGALEAVATSSLLTVTFVGCLYLPFNAGDRDDPRIVRSRLLTLALLTLLSEAYVRRRVPEAGALASAHAVPGAVAGLLLTALLYAGHLAARPLRDSRLDAHVGWVGARNYLFAPLLEEFVFRRHSLLLWRCLPSTARILVPAALFSAAHAHHALRAPLARVLAQLAYTLVFGVYAAALFVATNSLVPAVVAHVMCNFLGSPDLRAIAEHPWRRVIVVGYVAAVALFVALFSPILRSVTPPSVAAVL